MLHLWVRAEQRANEQRVGLTPQGAADLIARGARITLEDSPTRAYPTAAYAAAGCTVAPMASWPDAPSEAIILGLKELPEDNHPLRHRHIMFGHAFKGQPDGPALLRRFAAGGGTLLDLEYLTDDQGRRVVAFGYWAGFAGAAMAMKTYGAQMRGGVLGPVSAYAGRTAMVADAAVDLAGARPRVIVIGALGRTGRGACDLCADLGLEVTRWDMAETARGAPFPEVLAHEVFLNCILAMPGCPVFVPAAAGAAPRALRVIGDIACDPGSEYSPVQVYDRVTDWAQPARRVHTTPPLDVMAIDNLPSLLPTEASADFAAQLLPYLMQLVAEGGQIGDGHSGTHNVWSRARVIYAHHTALASVRAAP